MKKPKPVSKNVVCSECGLPWEAHTKRMKTSEATPTQADCVALLKVELAKPRANFYTQTTSGTNQSIPNILWGSNPASAQ